MTHAARTVIASQARRRRAECIALFAPWRGYSVVRLFADWRREDDLRGDPGFIPLSIGLPAPVYVEERILPMLRRSEHELDVVHGLFGGLTVRDPR